MADETTPIGATEHIAPEVDKQAFHCPLCHVYTSQHWNRLHVAISGAMASTVGKHTLPTDVRRSTCGNCKGHTYWLLDDAMPPFEAIFLWPIASPLAPLAHVDMPAESRAVYEEARSIVERSPRGAAALLRLAVQILMAQLGQKGKDINDDIGALVKDGLPVRVQQAFDTLRVTGNEAVHPGQIDFDDDRGVAVALFGIMNYIVEQQITQPAELDRLYGSLPDSKLQQIERRDAPPPAQENE